MKVSSSSENDWNSCNTSSSGESEGCERKVESNDVELMSSRRAQIPWGAIQRGKERNGDIYYIGRAEYKVLWLLEKVQPSYETL